MKKLNLLLVGLLCLSVVVHAGDVITNDTGEDVTGLRVTFSEPVLITGFGDVLSSVDTQMLSFEFIFSGGTVKPWESHWFNYAPATATVVETEWLVDSLISEAPQETLPSVEGEGLSSSGTATSSDDNSFRTLLEWDQQVAPALLYWPHAMPSPQYQASSGYSLKSLEFDYDDQMLRFRISLHSGDSFSKIDYNLFISGSSDFFYLGVLPLQGECSLETWTGVLLAELGCSLTSATQVVIEVPFSAFAPSATREDILDQFQVRIFLRYIRDDDGHDLLEFPGTATLLQREIVLVEHVPETISGLEYVGTPFLEAFPDGSGWEHARTVLDMAVFQDRVYFGHGSAQSNPGPIDVWSWDAREQAFAAEFTVDDEQISHLFVFDDQLFIPGDDAVGNSGNFYKSDGTSWMKYDTLSEAIHVSSLYAHDGNLYACGTAVASGESNSYSFARISADGGNSWSDLDYSGLPKHDTLGLFSLHGEVCVSGWFYDQQGRESGSATFRVSDNGSYSLIEDFDMFPRDIDEPSSELPAFVFRSAPFHEGILYIGRLPCMDLESFRLNTPVYFADSLSQDSVRRIPLVNSSEESCDVLTAGEYAWILTNELHADGTSSTVRVYRSSDPSDWEVILSFEAPTVASSFEILDGYIYFGLGPGHPHILFRGTGIGTGYRVGDNSPSCGDIYRVLLEGQN